MVCCTVGTAWMQFCLFLVLYELLYSVCKGKFCCTVAGFHETSSSS